MPKHHSEDYKLSAVKYYLNMEKRNYYDVARIFGCHPRTLQYWTKKYLANKDLSKKSRKEGSYKVTKEMVDYILEKVKETPDIIIGSLLQDVNDKFPNSQISRVHLGRIIRDNNRTRKMKTYKHFPKTYRGQPRNFDTELKKFMKEIKKYRLSDIISIDETALRPGMSINYARCQLGKRCVMKTDNNIIFTKYSFLVAISNKSNRRIFQPNKTLYKIRKTNVV